MKVFRYISALVVTLGGVVNAVADTSLTPGLYETRVEATTKMGDMQLPPNIQTSSNCITAEDIANGPPDMLPDDGQSCETLKYEFGDGKIEMEMVCQIQGGEGRMVGTGTYTSDSFQMQNKMKMSACARVLLVFAMCRTMDGTIM